MAFDVQAAKKAGYSDTEIANFLGQQSKFDVGAARKSGYSDAEIVGHLTKAPAKPKPQGYDKAKERIAKRDTDAKALNNRFAGPLAGLMNGASDLQRQVARNTGAFDEVAGGLSYLSQGAENIFRQATGKPIEISAGAAGKAAMDYEREGQASYAKANPGKNVLAHGLTIATTARPTGAATFTNPFQAGAAASVQNAPFALARQEGSLKERAPGAMKETAITFGTGAALTGGANALRARATRAAARPASPQRQVSRQGVDLTPGQMAGGTLQRMEDGLTSVPILGDSIRSARIRGVESFNRSALNRTVEPVGGQIPAGTNVGRDGLREAEQTIGAAYDNALTGVTVQPDSQFGQDIVQALHRRQLPPDAMQEVEAVLNNVADRARGPMDGRLWKELDSEIRTAADAADHASAQRPSMRYVRDTLRDVREAFRGVLERSAPQALASVREADAATANLARIRQASQYTGSSARNGVFSPADLNRAVQGMDTSAGNRQFARGDALMQDLTDPAMQVLPQQVPDSGTPFRSLMAVGGFGGGAAAIGADPVVVGASVAGLTGASALYSRPAISALNAIYRATNPGQAQQALSQLQALAARDPALVPHYERALQHLGLIEGPVAVGAE